MDIQIRGICYGKITDQNYKKQQKKHRIGNTPGYDCGCAGPLLDGGLADS